MPENAPDGPGDEAPTEHDQTDEPIDRRVKQHRPVDDFRYDLHI
jgi:hypothetical protein